MTKTETAFLILGIMNFIFSLILIFFCINLNNRCTFLEHLIDEKIEEESILHEISINELKNKIENR